MSDHVKQLVEIVRPPLTKWVICTLISSSGFGIWLTGEMAGHRFTRRAQEIFHDALAASSREPSATSRFSDPSWKPGSPAEALRALDCLEDEDRHIQLQLETCPSNHEKNLLQLKRRRCIEAQTVLTAMVVGTNAQRNLTQKQSQVHWGTESVEDNLRRRPYDAARLAGLLETPAISRQDAENRAQATCGHRPGS
jgi:hypothetical protein